MKPPRDRYIQWLAFADDDMSSARILLKEGIFNQACFHAQQAAEKSMKGYLKANGIRFQKTHNLIELCALCKKTDSVWRGFEGHCAYLSRFYVPARYPDAIVGSIPEGLPDQGQAMQAVERAEEMVDFVKEKLGEV